MHERLAFNGDLCTTAMGIMPHEDVHDALDLALQMDIPFWPQLPKLSFYEDMYVQAMEMFPGVVIDEERTKIFIDSGRFLYDLPQYLEREDDPELYRFSKRFSRVYEEFLTLDLSSYRSVRGQVISPVSLSLKITDENGKPIVYNDEIRALIFSFIQKKVNVQYRELRSKNRGAFVWVDDPGLEFVFNAMCGYDHVKAKSELMDFFSGIEGPRGLHLCGRPDWDFLLSLNIDILSFNAYAFGDVFVTYDKVKTFLEKGNIISWGIVPTYYEEFSREDVRSLAGRLEKMWLCLEEDGVDKGVIVKNSMLAPATCNMMNADKTATVEGSFLLVNELSDYVKERYGI
ncbi:MAG TPA: hypothetical protein PLX02_04825 [Syntrophorhabdaceae bacterium]|nr:hypothetical protein [Syntrophorhabdaceae bacterium]HQM80926.1 hypothetical protein [Syntrophorhabdaceae bacterium]